MFRKLIVFALVSLSPTIFSTAAMAATNRESCVRSDYGCQSWGYSGWDPYGYFNYSSVASDGLLHNCTSYAAFVLSQTTPYDGRWATLGSATTWASRAASYGLPVGTFPHVGDIAQWDFGHVAYVEKVLKSSSGQVLSIETTDDNFGRQVTTRKVLYPGSVGVIAYPDHFITFPQYGGGGSAIPPKMVSPVVVP